MDVYPTTYRVIELLGDFNIFFLILVIFYSGELIWKERDVKINLIYDALPYPNFVTIIGKFLSLIYVLLLLIVVLMTVGIVAQIIMGHTDIQFATYFNSLFVDLFFGMVLYAFLDFSFIPWSTINLWGMHFMSFFLSPL